jgi:hypothetical protein
MSKGLTRFSSFWIFPVLAISSLAFTFRSQPTNSLVDLVWLFPVGLCSWTLLEYGLHRFVFHREIRTVSIRKIINSSHMEHHLAPRDDELILVQPPYALAVSALLAIFIELISRNEFWTAGILSGVWAGFLYYEAVHYRVHITPANGWLLSRQRRAHFYHHYHDSNRRFGVTTPLWDYVFRSL